jgi:hypothetical protein
MMGPRRTRGHRLPQRRTSKRLANVEPAKAAGATKAGSATRRDCWAFRETRPSSPSENPSEDQHSLTGFHKAPASAPAPRHRHKTTCTRLHFGHLRDADGVQMIGGCLPHVCGIFEYFARTSGAEREVPRPPRRLYHADCLKKQTMSNREIIELVAATSAFLNSHDFEPVVAARRAQQARLQHYMLRERLAGIVWRTRRK